MAHASTEANRRKDDCRITGRAEARRQTVNYHQVYKRLTDLPPTPQAEPHAQRPEQSKLEIRVMLGHKMLDNIPAGQPVQFHALELCGEYGANTIWQAAPKRDGAQTGEAKMT